MHETDCIRRRGGLAATHELLAAGSTSHRLTAAVRVGAIIRVRQGWYGLPGADGDLEAAVRVGGRATSVTAVLALGLMSRPDGRLHVRVGAHASRLRDPQRHRQRLSGDRVCVHWRDGGVGSRHRLGAIDAISDMTECQSVERVVAAADSALRAGLMSSSAWERRVAHAPSRLRRLLLDVEPRCESYLESIARFRLRRLGFAPQVQVQIPDVGRVDMVLGRVVIELDGWEFHGSREAFERDRARDAECLRAGLIPLRFTSRQLLRRWAWVHSVIRDCVAGRRA